jgi:transposase
LALVADELHRRAAADKSGRFEQTVERAIARLKGMTRQPKSRPVRKQGPPSILDGKRNAIRAALKAGLRPLQVAKHFGVSLSDVRHVAAQAD